MADTKIAPNNQQVRFRGKGETMPPVSEKQRGAMAAAAEGKSNLGISKKVGKEFIAADDGGDLPDRADQLHKKGLISEKARDAAKAKARKKPGGDKGGGDKSDDQIEGDAEGGDGDKDKPKRGLSLDDE